MKLNLNQLSKQLQSNLSPLYLVSGDEPLLRMEAEDSIRLAARQKGYTERQLITIDAHFDWNILYETAASLSLFAEKRLIELRFKNASLNDKGVALLNYLQHPPSDTLLLLSMPKVDTKLKWVKTLLETPLCQVIQVWPITASELPTWIKQRLAQLNLSISDEALELFTLRVEGNLLAAAQEIEKLKLLMANHTIIETQHILAMVTDNARFDLFSLIDSALKGDTLHALRTLQGLKAEGIAETLILWSLAKELRTLLTLLHLTERHIPIDHALSQLKPPIWIKRHPLFKRAAKHLTTHQLKQAIIKTQHIDAQIKGQSVGNCWEGFTDIILILGGYTHHLNSLQ